jgi:hypothetical protein
VVRAVIAGPRRYIAIAMRVRLPSHVVAAASVAMAAALAGCGSRGHDRVPDLASLPLVGGSRIVTQARVCDSGANAYCAYDLVVASSRYHTSEQFLLGERGDLRRLGWTGANPPNGDERAVDSPSGGLHLTYATATGDLTGLDLGWIQRARGIATALSRAIFRHTPALSMELRFGAS